VNPLTPTELAVLAAVHRADEEEGGLLATELEADEREALDVLAQRALVELRVVDEDDMSTVSARISPRGVEVLRELGIRR
jgi:hypothetical protein